MLLVFWFWEKPLSLVAGLSVPFIKAAFMGFLEF